MRRPVLSALSSATTPFARIRRRGPGRQRVLATSLTHTRADNLAAQNVQFNLLVNRVR